MSPRSDLRPPSWGGLAFVGDHPDPSQTTEVRQRSYEKDGTREELAAELADVLFTVYSIAHYTGINMDDAVATKAETIFSFQSGMERTIMNTQAVTAHDPCPQCGGYDSAHWTDSGPGYDDWACKCGERWTIMIEEPNQIER